jgi:protein TonB
MAQIIKADMDEMVFEDRERRYGAFFLRKVYPGHLVIGTAIVAIIMTLYSFIPLTGLFKPEKVEEVKVVNVTLKMEDLPPPPPLEEENKPPPPPPPKAPPPKIKTVAFNIPEPTPEDELDPEEDNTLQDIEKLKEAKVISTEDQEGEDIGYGDINFEEEGDGEEFEMIIEQEPDINDFIFAEEEPKPVNMGDIQKLIGYPQIARDAGIEGNVVVRVLVDKNGNYSKHKIITQVHPILTKAVEEHIRKLKFTPAIQGGKPIKFWVNIPFNFKLLN